MNLPEVNGKNYQKILRELDLSKFPSMPEFLKEIHYKLNKKNEISFDECAFNEFPYASGDWTRWCQCHPFGFEFTSSR